MSYISAIGAGGAIGMEIEIEICIISMEVKVSKYESLHEAPKWSKSQSLNINGPLESQSNTHALSQKHLTI